MNGKSLLISVASVGNRESLCDQNVNQICSVTREENVVGWIGLLPEYLGVSEYQVS